MSENNNYQSIRLQPHLPKVSNYLIEKQNVKLKTTDQKKHPLP